ncbi:MAG: hypothetical protein KGL11_10050 [Alphaproteobacteria bacterium]|nr:hypothetical protein [Alphaproteobacteria bacterium]
MKKPAAPQGLKFVFSAEPPVALAAKDQELTELLTVVNLEWERLENLLFKLFALLLDCPWQCSRTIYFVHQNHRARRDMIAALAELVLAKKTGELEKVRSFLRRAKTASSNRNSIIHAVWAVADIEGKSELVRQPVDPNLVKQHNGGLTRADIKRAFEQIHSLSKDLAADVEQRFMERFKIGALFVFYP